MTEMVLFHSGLGLRPHVLAWKSELELRGHKVHTPDLYDGEVFDDLAAGLAKRDALGVPELSARSAAAVADLPADIVYAGFSLGAAAAQGSALQRPGARGLIMMHAALPLAAFGLTEWPADLRVQFHGAESDPWVDYDVVDSLEAAAMAKTFDRFSYPGSPHLFADVDFEDYDATLASRMFNEVADFLDRVG